MMLVFTDVTYFRDSLVLVNLHNVYTQFPQRFLKIAERFIKTKNLIAKKEFKNVKIKRSHNVKKSLHNVSTT